VRLFVALEIPSTVRENLAALIENLRSISRDPKWVRPENLHVTLKFLGEVPDARVGTIREALGEILSEQSVTLKFRGVGFFPNEKHPRVFWAGIQASPNLARLAGGIEAAMEKCGIAREERAFSPHLTLARIESRRLPDKLLAGIAENMQRDFGTLQTNELHLIQSKLKPSGAEYTTLARFVFAPSEA
jgi:RNA 2',3'-cyclic 3'-phosphodiesterase